MKWLARLYSLITGVLVGLVAVPAAQARELCPAAFASLCKIKIEDDAGGIVGTIIVVLIIIAAVTCLFFLIFGGIKFMTAAGDQGKTQQARSHIIAAIVGLIISLAAFLIVNVVMYVVTGTGIEGMTIPKL